MHKDFSALNKLMQDNLKKQTTFSDGIKNLLQLRNNLMEEIDLIFKTTSPEDFFALPFPKSDSSVAEKSPSYSKSRSFNKEEFFKLVGKVNLDSSSVTELREKSLT